MSIDCFEELFISEFCDIIIFSCLLYNALLMSFPHDYQFTNLQGHPTTIFGKYLFGRRFEIQNFRSIFFQNFLLVCLS